jgi:hypothetical protein
VIVSALAVAGVLLVWVYNNSAVGSDNASRPAGVERYIPEAGSDVLTQSAVGVDVAEGYDADLEINGVRISNVTEDPNGDGLMKNLSIGLIQYTPGPGKTIEKLEPTKNCIVAHVWRIIVGRSTSKPASWCFDAT